MSRETMQEASSESRYDAQTLSRVVALAQQLERHREETLSVQEIENIGAELGTNPAFLRQALTQVRAGKRQASEDEARKREFAAAVGPLAAPIILGVVVFITSYLLWPHPLLVEPLDREALGKAGLARLLALIAPLPLSLLLGFLSGKRGVGFLAGLMMAFAMSPALAYLTEIMGTSNSADTPIFYATLGGLVNGGLGWLGARVHEHYFSTRQAVSKLSRLDLIEALHDIQKQLQRDRRHSAFLSIDVVGSTAMKQRSPELAVEYSFGQFRRWVEETVQGEGGKLQSAAGDGLMCMFPTDTGALRAARQLQEGMPRFNADKNRLSSPFRIRCGISAGEVSLEEGVPLGELQSSVVDRAAMLQKRADPGAIVVSGEVAAAGLVELGTLSPLPEQGDEERSFSWSGAQ